MAEYIERETVRADGCDEVSKIKTPFAWIIVEGTADKPYYSILWLDTEKKECYVGYSSYCLKYVFNWLKEEFEITEKDADVEPVRHGEWEIVVGSNGKEYMVCTCCRVSQDLSGVFSYCPNCGAKMDLEG